jgi:hypothetical protein
MIFLAKRLNLFRAAKSMSHLLFKGSLLPQEL